LYYQNSIAMDKIYAGIATMKSRGESLKAMLKSIIDQVDHIFIYLNGYDTVPLFVKHPKITPFLPKYHKGDMGSNGKFYKASDPNVNGYFFTMDDDIVYAQNYCSKMIQKLEEYDRKIVVSCHGRTINGKIESYYKKDNSDIYGFTRKVESDQFISVVGTGVMVHHTDTIRFNCSEYPATNMDDIYTSIICQKNNVPRLVMAHENNWLRETKLVPSVLTISTQTRKDDSKETNLINNTDWTIQKYFRNQSINQKDENCIDVVYPYVVSRNDEIIYSIRSLEENLKVPFRVVVIGAPPEKLNLSRVLHIPYEKKIGFDYENNTDTTGKMAAICNNPDISENFLWIADDVYLANPVYPEDYSTIVHMGTFDPSFANNITSGGKWRQSLMNSVDALTKKNLPVFNFESHTPRLINKEKMRKIIEEFNPSGKRMQQFTLYYNRFPPESMIKYSKELSIKAGFYGIENNMSFNSNIPANRLIEIFKNHTYINHNDTGYTASLREAIQRYFPNKSKYEL